MAKGHWGPISRAIQRTLARLPELLETLEEKCAANGIRVRWAETTEQANAIVPGSCPSADQPALLPKSLERREPLKIRGNFMHHGQKQVI